MLLTESKGAFKCTTAEPSSKTQPVFFAVNLAERSSRLLIDHVDDLRAVVRLARGAHPFEIIAWVVSPDHLHTVFWRLPQAEAMLGSIPNPNWRSSGQ